MHQALAKVVSDPEWQIHENEVNLEGLPMVEEKPKLAAEGKKGLGKFRKIKKSPFAEEKVSFVEEVRPLVLEGRVQQVVFFVNKSALIDKISGVCLLDRRK